MKFGDYLKSIEREAPDEYRGRWLKYKQLKKNIKQCKRGRAETSWSDLSSAEKEFFQELQREVRQVNRWASVIVASWLAAEGGGLPGPDLVLHNSRPDLVLHNPR